MYLKLRRILEITAIVVLSPIILPIAAVTAIIIKIESPGKVLFYQLRPGINGKPFTMIKFRTMNERPGESFRLTAREDERVTRVGKILRKYKIDELPQFLNVLKGDMSIIGPRPEPLQLTAELEKLIPDYKLRRSVLPGLTGWAQIQQGYTETIEEKAVRLEYDLYYIENISLGLDLKIVVMTVLVILKGEKSR